MEEGKRKSNRDDPTVKMVGKGGDGCVKNVNSGKFRRH